MYKDPPESGYVRQGEILKDVYERSVLAAPVKAADEPENHPIEEVYHPWVIVLSPDCDLFWDYKERQKPADECNHAKLLDHIVCCPLHPDESIKAKDGIRSNQWKAIRGNLNARYHHFKAAEAEGMPSLTIDLKRVLGFSAAVLHGKEHLAQLTRVAVVDRIYREDLVQRFGAFQSRVSLPD